MGSKFSRLKTYLYNTVAFFKNKGYERGGVVQEKIYVIGENQSLENKNILITGGSTGIGYAVAKRSIDSGASVIITGRNEDKLKIAKDNLGEKCEYIVWDVTDFNNMENKLSEVDRIFEDRIDILVNNAGFDIRREYHEINEEIYDAIMDVQMKSVYFLTQAVCKRMEQREIQGNICMITSHSGIINDFRPYNLAKAAINNYVKGVAKYAMKSGRIRCNAVAPGPTSTDLYKEFTEVRESNNSYRQNAPAQRFYRAEEVAEVVCFVISDLAKCVNGQVIVCDGGKAIL